MDRVHEDQKLYITGRLIANFSLPHHSRLCPGLALCRRCWNVLRQGDSLHSHQRRTCKYNRKNPLEKWEFLFRTFWNNGAFRRLKPLSGAQLGENNLPASSRPERSSLNLTYEFQGTNSKSIECAPKNKTLNATLGEEAHTSAYALPSHSMASPDQEEPTQTVGSLDSFGSQPSLVQRQFSQPLNNQYGDYNLAPTPEQFSVLVNQNHTLRNRVAYLEGELGRMQNQMTELTQEIRRTNPKSDCTGFGGHNSNLEELDSLFRSHGAFSGAINPFLRMSTAEATSLQFHNRISEVNQRDEILDALPDNPDMIPEASKDDMFDQFLALASSPPQSDLFEG